MILLSGTHTLKTNPLPTLSFTSVFSAKGSTAFQFGTGVTSPDLIYSSFFSPQMFLSNFLSSLCISKLLQVRYYMEITYLYLSLPSPKLLEGREVSAEESISESL